MLRLLIATTIATSLATAVAQTSSSRGDQLTAAFERGDSVDMKRKAVATSAATMEALLETGDRRAVLAATLAAPHADDAPLLLVSLSGVAYSADRSVALSAARAGLAIVRQTDSARYRELEILRSDLAEAIRQWHSLARDDERWADVRVLALEITAALATELAGNPSAPIIELIGDDDPELRVAAFELLPAPLPAAHSTRAAAAVTNDKSDRVALTAAATLCGGLAFGDPVDASGLLESSARKRLLALVLDRQFAPALRLEAGHCLPAIGSADKLAALAESLPPDLAARARSLSKRAKSSGAVGSDALTPRR